MSAPAEICDSCGKTITDEELESGAGISLLGKSFCPACKEQAIRDISLDDLAAPAAAAPSKPAPLPPPPPAKAEARTVRPKDPPPVATPRSPAKPVVRVERDRDPGPSETPKTILKPATRRITLATRRSGHPALYAGIGAAAVLAVAGIFMLTRGDGAASRRDPGGKTESSGTAPSKPPLDPEAARKDKAEQAYLKLLLLARQPGISPREILDAIARAKPDCAGTPFEKKLEDFRAETAKAQESVEAMRVLDPLIAELRTAFPADSSFARYDELTTKFQKAKELAVSVSPERIPELNRIRQEYVERYEEKARPYVEEIEPAAKILSDEKRYDDAIAKIETFPRELRLSGAWKGLEQLKQQIERQRKLFPPKK